MPVPDYYLDDFEHEEEASGRGGAFHTCLDLNIVKELGLGFFKAAVGKNIVAILQPPAPCFVPMQDRRDEKGRDRTGFWGQVYYSHWNLGVDGNDAFLCPRAMWGKPCPICEERDRLLAADQADEASLFSWRRRILMWIVDVTTSQVEAKGIQIFDASNQMSRDIRSQCRRMRTGEVVWITDPDKGADIGFERKGTTKNTTKYFGHQLVERSVPVPQEWLDAIPKETFESLFVVPTPEEIREALEGTVPAPKEEKPSPRTGGQPKMATRTSRGERKTFGQELDEAEAEDRAARAAGFPSRRGATPVSTTESAPASQSAEPEDDVPDGGDSSTEDEDSSNGADDSGLSTVDAEDLKRRAEAMKDRYRRRPAE